MQTFKNANQQAKKYFNRGRPIRSISQNKVRRFPLKELISGLESPTLENYSTREGDLDILFLVMFGS